jgi:hypothetical protein
MQTLRTVRMNRSDLVPHFMAGLEASLAAWAVHPRPPHRPTNRLPSAA